MAEPASTTASASSFVGQRGGRPPGTRRGSRDPRSSQPTFVTQARVTRRRARQERPAQEGHGRAAARVDRAAVGRAVAAVVAGGPPVVGLRVRSPSGRGAARSRAGRGARPDQARVHGRARWHGIGSARRVLEHELRRVLERALHADHALGQVVVRERARRSRRASRPDPRPRPGRSGSASRSRAGRSAGPWRPSAWCRLPPCARGAFTSPTYECARSCLGLALGAEGAGLGQHVDAREAARDADLVAAEEGEGEASRRVELAEVVAPLLEHAHLEARRGQHPGRRRAAGPRADHDYVLRHAQARSGRGRIAPGARSLRPR